MPKNKLIRFAEMQNLPNVFQPSNADLVRTDFNLRGVWGKEFFKNDRPIVLELGCGKGEYCIGLAEKYPEKNFIGIDKKGARMYVGAKTALDNTLSNVAFLRIYIDNIASCFARGEISEIWLTFPDPQLKKSNTKKRLTSSRFLNKYRNILKTDGIIHLKTDSFELHYYSLTVIGKNNLPVLVSTDDLYGSGFDDDILAIKTFYENQFLAVGKKITYLRFKLPGYDVEEPE